MPAQVEEPGLLPEHLTRADADPEAPRDFGRGVPFRSLAGHGVAREDDSLAPARNPRRDQEVVHRRSRRERLDPRAPRGIDRAVGAQTNPEAPLRFLRPGLAVPEPRLGRRPGRSRLENEPPADGADVRIAEGFREALHGSRLESRVRVGEDDDVGPGLADEVV